MEHKNPLPPEQVRTQLSNPELERALLNSLLNERHGADFALQHLTDECFYVERYLVIYHAIRDVYARGIAVSMLSVHDELRRTKGDEWIDQNMNDLLNISTQSEEPMELSRMVQVLTEYASRRALGPVITQLTKVATDLGCDLRHGIEVVEQGLQRALGCEIRQSFVTMRDLMVEARQVMADNLNPATQHLGLMTGLPQLDQDGGLPRGSFIVVGGKSSHGKTSFANYLALQTLQHGGSVAYFSMEMSNLELVQRFLSMESRVSGNAIAHLPLYDNLWREAHSAADRLDGWGSERFYFDRAMDCGFEHMVQCIRSLNQQRATIDPMTGQRRPGLDLVVVDYLQLLDVGEEVRGETRASLLARASHQMKNLSRQTGVTILALSQTNRNCVGIPSSENFLDSSAIKQAADLTYIIFCAEAEGPKGLDAYPAPFQEFEPHNTLLVIQDKGRTLGTKSFLVGFERRLTRVFALPESPVGDGRSHEGGLQMEMYSDADF